MGRLWASPARLTLFFTCGGGLFSRCRGLFDAEVVLGVIDGASLGLPRSAGPSRSSAAGFGVMMFVRVLHLDALGRCGGFRGGGPETLNASVIGLGIGGGKLGGGCGRCASTA